MTLSPTALALAVVIYITVSAVASRFPPTSRIAEILQGLLIDLRKIAGLDALIPKLIEKPSAQQSLPTIVVEDASRKQDSPPTPPTQPPAS